MEAYLKWICWVVNQRNVMAKERKSLRNRRRSYKSMPQDAVDYNESCFKIINFRLSEHSRKYTKDLRSKLKVLGMKLLDNRDAGYSGIISTGNKLTSRFVDISQIELYAREYEAELAILDALKE